MYDLHDYARMIADEGRMAPYLRALEAVLRPGSVVADVGTGTGILALVACRLGARRVYAIETNDCIEVARLLARENAVDDRIVFFHRDAREVELPERADVVVSDLRGAVPLYGDHLAVIADARERFLKPGGVLVPASDRLMVAVVERADVHAWALGPAAGPLGVSLEAMRARLANATFAIREATFLGPDDVVSHPAQWATLDYATVEAASVAGRAELRIRRPATGHGLVVWFDATLAGGHGFSNAAGHDISYGRLFFPWPRPVSLEEGDLVGVELWAQPGGDPWGWNSTVAGSRGPRAEFKQSSFLSLPARPAARSLAAEARGAPVEEGGAGRGGSREDSRHGTLHGSLQRTGKGS